MLSKTAHRCASAFTRSTPRGWSQNPLPKYLSTGAGQPMMDYESRDLTGRRIMVTGANRGMGFELSKQLAERGARVIAVGRDESAIHTAAESITGVQFRHSIKALMQSVQQQHGHLSGLVLNASIMPGFMQPVFGVDDELEEQTFRINVEGYWFCVKYAMPLLLASPTDFERTVVFVSGLAGALEKPVPGLGMLPYSASLAAENGLMVRLHQEMVDDNAGAVQLRGGSKDRKDKLQRVVSLHPGIVATGLGRETMEGGSVEQITQNKAKSGHFVDIKTGVDSMTWLMAAQDGVVQSGKFYDQRGVIPF